MLKLDSNGMAYNPDDFTGNFIIKKLSGNEWIIISKTADRFEAVKIMDEIEKKEPKTLFCISMESRT